MIRKCSKKLVDIDATASGTSRINLVFFPILVSAPDIEEAVCVQLVQQIERTLITQSDDVD